MRNVFKIIFLTTVMCFFLFPIGFRGLPSAMNTKHFLFALAFVIYVCRCMASHSLKARPAVVTLMLISIVFSVWCFFSCVYNGTSDYAYATYIESFFLWFGSAYAVCELIKACYGRLDLELLVRYMTLAGVWQCIAVILVANVPWFQTFVDNWIIQDGTAKEVGRYYGIGCSLDSGGVRFCMILIMLGHVLTRVKSVTDSSKAVFRYSLAFLFMCVVGNMVARTTTVGMALALLYIVISVGVAHNAQLTAKQLRIRAVFLSLLVAGSAALTYFYLHDVAFRHDLRFAFEAFFNFVEKGELRTDSSDALMARMWIWPWSREGWLVGYGLFEWSYWDSYGFQTDIGYCRFVLYCGLVGMFLFSVYFIVNAYFVGRRFKDAWLLACILIVLTFVIWLKVSTDIFQLYALLLCVPNEFDSPEVPEYR